MEEKSHHCGKPNCDPETCLCTSNEEAPKGLTLEVWEESLKKLKDKLSKTEGREAPKDVLIYNPRTRKATRNM